MSYILVLMPVVGVAAIIVFVTKFRFDIPIELRAMVAGAAGIPIAYAGQSGWIRFGIENTAGAFLLSVGSEILTATIIWLLWKCMPRLLP
jgi:hypothetical protein